MPTATPSPRSSSTWCGAVGLLGRRRVSQGQGDRRLCRSVEAPCARSQGQVFLGQRPAQHVAAAAGPSDHRAVRLVGCPASSLRRAPPTWCSPRSRASTSAQAFYREPEGPARARSAAGRSRSPSCRGSCRCSAAPRRRRATSSRMLDSWTDQSKVAADAVRPARPRRHRTTISTARCRSCRRPTSCRAAPSCSPTLARRDNLTLRQLAQLVATGRGHYVMCGTPEQIADRMEEWFREGGADGFNVMPPYFPGGLDDFADGVIPILQKRGLFRTEYEGPDAARPLRLCPPAEPASRARARAERARPESRAIVAAQTRIRKHQECDHAPRIVVVPPSHADIGEMAKASGAVGLRAGRLARRPRRDRAGAADAPNTWSAIRT